MGNHCDPQSLDTETPETCGERVETHLIAPVLAASHAVAFQKAPSYQRMDSLPTKLWSKAMGLECIVFRWTHAPLLV